MMHGTTQRRVLGVAALATAAVLLITARDEPHAVPGELRVDATAGAIGDFRPAIASVTVPRPRASSVARFAPAPAGESQPDRALLHSRPPRSIALGHNARGMCDPALERAFADGADGDVTFTPCADRDGVELVQVGRADMALLGGALSPRELGLGLRETRVAVELLALAVATDFPLQSLTIAQVRQLLTGDARDWWTLGCDRGAVVVVVPAEKGLATRAAGALLAGQAFADDAVRVVDDRGVADQLLRNPGAVAVVRVHWTPPRGMKLLQIDWTPPSADAFRCGAYPYGTPLHVVTLGVPGDVAREFLAFAAGGEGRALLQRTLLLPRGP